MHPFPHIYNVVATGTPTGSVSVATNGAPTLLTAPPIEFDGPGDQWSPEGLLCAAIADCFILTFRSVARASKLEWRNLECRVEGKLDRQNGRSLFTQFVTYASVTVARGADLDQVNRLLEKAEHGCLVANSLSATRSLETQVTEYA
jgi:organic hydroperoxide reductase OsmC/OhrA